jgi:acyl-CoA synthetase (AMP-forming)/AMP-acid ligase II
VRPLTGQPFGTGLGLEIVMRMVFGFSPSSVYLCPGPLYHAAPLGWSTGTTRIGGTVVVMERFDAAAALSLIERYRITEGQFVPTMFVRMLRLPEAEREKYDLSSLRLAVHAAAPVAVEVKRAMIDWLGPVLAEYYAGSEGNGICVIDSADWLAHPGSVGRPLGVEVHIVGEDGAEVPAGEVGTVYFSGGSPFEYHNDPGKTASAFNPSGWSTLGDMGYVDDEGYLYLADRRTDLIVSGGVNIYPREVEEALAPHPAVADVAVIAVPDAEMGQRVHAVVQPAVAGAGSPELAAELIEFCRARIARFKSPGSVTFEDSLPRTPSGKMLRRVVAERYRDGAPAATSSLPAGQKDLGRDLAVRGRRGGLFRGGLVSVKSDGLAELRQAVDGQLMLVADQVRGFQDDALHDRALAQPVDPVHAVVGVAGLPADAERRRVVFERG